MNRAIGQKLAQLRRERGLSQKDIAELLNQSGASVTNQAVSKWENGVSQPNTSQFLLLCQILKVEDISGEFLGLGLGANLNHEGREKLSEYANLLKLSELYKN